AQTLSGLENMILLLDPNHHRLTVRQATYPAVLLLLYGNAEIPFLELVRDVQQYSISRMIVKSLGPRMEEIKKRFKETESLLAKPVFDSYMNKLAEIDAGLARLRDRPFALTSLSIQGVTGPGGMNSGVETKVKNFSPSYVHPVARLQSSAR
ncbi:MAG: hypothetical protein NDI61_04605, partial [Bdellovibrionaceae bacterium]|nr:hypothetical protein [Pseudobdellovibrionaceae bacterium]